ncbi:hypothetical protein [Bdellovibrio sp. HCB288]|uniref:hypothetical protein n=1 Tax=Bdellovibrio sp. HCB288 TaxID=3394355 RepID=UPI0039B54568
MRILFYLFFILAPVFAMAQINYGTLVESDWATPASKDYPAPDPGKNPEEKFLPSYITQDTLGICYAAAASTILNFEQCKQMNVKNCKTDLGDDKRVSSVGIARYVRHTNTMDDDDTRDENYSKLGEGGDGTLNLSMAVDIVERLPSEKCVSLDKILSKGAFKNKEEITLAQRAIWDNLKEDYDKYREAVASNCKDCADKYYQRAAETVSKNMKIEEDQKSTSSLRSDPAKLLAAFQKDTYEEALNTLLYPAECSNPKNGIELAGKNNYEVKYFPEVGKANREQALGKIVSILQSRQPVLLEPICVADCSDEDKKKCVKACTSKECSDACGPKYHAAVVAGYRKICKKDNPSSCRYALKVINSGGASWQKANNDGWLEADPLMKNVEIDSLSMAWLGAKKN